MKEIRKICVGFKPIKRFVDSLPSVYWIGEQQKMAPTDSEYLWSLAQNVFRNIRHRPPEDRAHQYSLDPYCSFFSGRIFDIGTYRKDKITNSTSDQLIYARQI